MPRVPGSAGASAPSHASPDWLPSVGAEKKEIEAFLRRARGAWLSSAGAVEAVPETGLVALSAEAVNVVLERHAQWAMQHGSLKPQLEKFLADARLAVKQLPS